MGVRFTSISEKHSLSIILRLRELDRPAMVKELSGFCHNQTLRRILENMRKDGIADIETEISDRKKVFVSLTDTGREIALILSMINSSVSPSKQIGEKSVDMRYADVVLTMMHGKDYVTFPEITSMIPSNITVKNLLLVMVDDGLVSMNTPPGKQRPMMYSLTPLGKQTADAYLMIRGKIPE